MHQPFVIKTDQQSLLNTYIRIRFPPHCNKNGCPSCWDSVIQLKNGARNATANALSRVHCNALTQMALSSVQFTLYE